MLSLEKYLLLAKGAKIFSHIFHCWDWVYINSGGFVHSLLEVSADSNLVVTFNHWHDWCCPFRMSNGLYDPLSLQLFEVIIDTFRNAYGIDLALQNRGCSFGSTFILVVGPVNSPRSFPKTAFASLRFLPVLSQTLRRSAVN